MRKTGHKWLIAAAILVAVGTILLVGGLTAMDFDFARLSTAKYQTNTYELSEAFTDLLVNVETAAVTFVPSDTDTCRVVCVEEESQKHSVSVQAGTLTIKTADTRRWYDYIGIRFQSPTITVYLPGDEYASVSVATATGDITISDRLCFETVSVTGTTANVSCSAAVTKSIELTTSTGNICLSASEPETVRLSATTGNIAAQKVTCGQLTAQSSTGRIELTHVLAREHIQARSTTGGVKFVNCDAAEITVKTSTGSVKGTLLSKKIFVTATSTGSVSVPASTGGGRCEITTRTGDIKIEIP